MITSLGANPWRTPSFETAPWRDTHNSAPTSETVPQRLTIRRPLTLRGVTSAVGVQFAIERLRRMESTTGETPLGLRGLTQLASTHAASAIERLRTVLMWPCPVTSLTVPRTWLAEAFLLTDPRQGDWPEVVEYRRGLIGRGLIGEALWADLGLGLHHGANSLDVEIGKGLGLGLHRGHVLGLLGLGLGLHLGCD